MNTYLSYYIKHLSNLTYANLASICRNLFVAGAICNNSRFIDEALKYAEVADKICPCENYKLLAGELCLQNNQKEQGEK